MVCARGDKLKSKNFINDFIVNAKTYFKTNILFISYFVLSLLNATLLRFFTVKNYFALKPILADAAIIILVGALGYLVKPKNQFKYFLTWNIIFTLTCLINSVYYTNYLSYASFSLLATAYQVVAVADAVTESIIEIKDFSYLVFPAILIVIHLYLTKNNYYEKVKNIEKGKKMAINTLIVGGILFGLFLSSLTSVDISRLNKQWNREYVVMQFGIYTYQINDGIASLKPQISPLFGYDDAAKEFREYYEENTREKSKNKYTNIFKGKNLLMIHAESIQNFLLGEEFNGIEVTPNLNRLSREGLYFSNFYAQESVGTSSDSEFTLNTSLMPATSGTVFVSYWDREYVSIPKLLKEKNYYTFSMHGNNPTFWNRNNMHKKLGYDKYYAYEDAFEIDETIGLGLSDKSFFKQVVPKIKEISETYDNFYGTLIMLTNHTPWTDIEGNTDYEVDYKYTNEQGEVVSAPYLEGTTMGNYIKSVHYADEAIGQLIDDLDKEGLLEDTVIVIYGDHDAKLKKSEYARYYNYDAYTDTVLDKDDPNYIGMDFYAYELNREVPFIIWSKNNKFKTEITKVMGMYDVLPTLGNMFDFYNPYALGHDIFSVDENVVVFPDGNWLTNKMYYNSQKEEGMLLQSNETVSADYIEKYNRVAEEAVSVSDKIIIYDLIKKTKETNELLEQYQNNVNN